MNEPLHAAWVSIQRALAWRALPFIVALLFCFHWIGEITDGPATGDSIHTVHVAVNFARGAGVAGELVIEPDTGIIRIEESDSPRPTMYREPIPIAAAALGVVLTELFMGRADTAAYIDGDRARYLKYQNVLWKAITTLSAAWILLTITSSPAIALIGVILVGTLRPQIDTLLSEPIAAALVTLSAALVMRAFMQQRLAWSLAAGLCLGLLALTRAAAFYVVIGLIVALPIAELWVRRARPSREFFVHLAAMACAFAACVVPWMARNHALIGRFQITERAGLALYTRGLKDQMTADEYRGSFYAWSDPRLQSIVGLLIGFDASDLERNGRLQRLNRGPSSFSESGVAAERAGEPERAVSFYRQGRAQRVRLARRYQDAGNPRPLAAADAELHERGMALILEHPAKHLAVTLPMLWRGAPWMFPVLLLTLIYALRARRRDLLLLTLLPLGYVCAVALFVNFESRYGDWVMPVTVVTALGLITSLTGLPRPRVSPLVLLRDEAEIVVTPRKPAER